MPFRIVRADIFIHVFTKRQTAMLRLAALVLCVAAGLSFYRFINDDRAYPATELRFWGILALALAIPLWLRVRWSIMVLVFLLMGVLMVDIAAAWYAVLAFAWKELGLALAVFTICALYLWEFGHLCLRKTQRVVWHPKN